MNDIDRYLQREYKDADYRRYLIQTSHPSLVHRLSAWLTRLVAAWRCPLEEATALPEGEQRLGPRALGVWKVGSTRPNLHCVSGSLWLTLTGDPRDGILVAGQSRRLEAGVWLIQALTPAAFTVHHPIPEEVLHGQASLLSAL